MSIRKWEGFMVLTCRLLTHGSWSLIKFSSSSWRQKWDTCLREGLKILRPGSILLKVWHITAHAIISQSLTSVYIPSARNGVDRWIWLWPVLRSSSILRGRSSSGSIQVWRGKKILYLIDWRDSIGNFSGKAWVTANKIYFGLSIYISWSRWAPFVSRWKNKKKGPLDFFKKFCRIMKRLPAQSFDGRVSIILR